MIGNQPIDHRFVGWVNSDAHRLSSSCHVNAPSVNHLLHFVNMPLLTKVQHWYKMCKVILAVMRLRCDHFNVKHWRQNAKVRQAVQRNHIANVTSGRIFSQKIWSVTMAVYFVERRSDKAIKIGRAVDVYKRIASFKTVAQDVVLLGFISGDAKKERGLHRQFESHRIAREWFAPHPSIYNFIIDYAIEALPSEEQAEMRDYIEARASAFRSDGKVRLPPSFPSDSTTVLPKSGIKADLINERKITRSLRAQVFDLEGQVEDAQEQIKALEKELRDMKRLIEEREVIEEAVVEVEPSPLPIGDLSQWWGVRMSDLWMVR
jgi:hypothetical protein